MYTIYFRIPNTNDALSVSVIAEKDLKHAQAVWDRLSFSFEMIAARP